MSEVWKVLIVVLWVLFALETWHSHTVDGYHGQIHRSLIGIHRIQLGEEADNE